MSVRALRNAFLQSFLECIEAQKCALDPDWELAPPLQCTQIAERLDVPKAKLTTLMGRCAKKIGGADLELLGRYRAASTEIVRGLATKLREQVREIFPTCLLGGYILDHFGGTRRWEADGADCPPTLFL